MTIKLSTRISRYLNVFSVGVFFEGSPGPVVAPTGVYRYCTRIRIETIYVGFCIDLFFSQLNPEETKEFVEAHNAESRQEAEFVLRKHEQRSRRRQESTQTQQ